MRGFGRRCRGQGRVFVTLVRQTEQQLLALGEPITAFGLKAQERLAHTLTLGEAQRQRLILALTTAMDHYAHIRKQSTQLTQGKKLSHCKLVNAYDPTIAPIVKGKSNCPAQFGRKPGIVSEPATGFIFANLVPTGNPSDPSYVLPLIDKVQHAIERIQTGPQRQIHSVAGDLGLNDAVVRQALHARGILTVGIPKTVEPMETNLSAQDVWHILNEAGLHRKRTPYQVHLACASGYSRPVVESHIASLLARGAGHVRYKGLEGAVLQQGMTVLAHNGAVIVRIRRQQVSKRAQKFRRLLGLKLPKVNQINHPKN
jgi:energy-coupling factor transporter ATP-binding protein EcfA2